MATMEIEVFGAGIFGLTIAYACQKRGARVRIIETRGVGAGASGGVVGALAPHTPDNWNDKKQFQFESLIASQGFWDEVDTISGQSSGYARIGRIIPIPEIGVIPLARERTETAKVFWKGHAEWSVVEPSKFEGWSPDSPTCLLTYDSLSARINPAAACQSLATAFLAKGGEIVEQRPSDSRPDATVFCTGYEGLAALSEDVGKQVGTGVKGQGILLGHSAPNQPQIFADGVHFIPHENGTLAIGSTSEREFENPSETDENLDALYDRAMAICPQFAGAKIIQRWAAVRPRSKRRTPMLGVHPTRANTFVANGGFKIGFGVSVKAGDVMADLIMDGRNEIPDSFSVEANL